MHFQARGHSFSLYGPTLSRPITCLSFFSFSKFAYMWDYLLNFVIELAYGPFINHSKNKLTNEKARNSGAKQRKMY